jgi:hypothetical protein
MSQRIVKILFVAVVLLFGFAVGRTQQVGTVLTNGNGVPSGACVSGSIYADSSSGWQYTCKGSLWQLGATQAMVFKRGIAGCTTGIIATNPCATPITVTWSVAFPDTNYTPVCWPSGAPSNEPLAPYLVAGSKLAGSIQVNYQTAIALSSSWSTIDCVAIHD